jgi:hypothetical protein
MPTDEPTQHTSGSGRGLSGADPRAGRGWPSGGGLLEAAASLSLCGICLATTLAFAGGLWWPLDLLAHFRVQYLVLAAALAAVLLLAGRRRAAGAAAARATANLFVVLPYLVPAARGPAGPGASVASVMCAPTTATPARCCAGCGRCAPTCSC